MVLEPEVPVEECVGGLDGLDPGGRGLEGVWGWMIPKAFFSEAVKLHRWQLEGETFRLHVFSLWERRMRMVKTW
jgi:hypothetical protein